MKSERIERLEKFLLEDPKDPFLIYALATEYNNFDKKEAKRRFEQLLAEHPNYSATYYHAAALFAELGEIERAKEVYETGIALTEKSGENHANKELRNAYQNFLFEEDL